jgi:hypothetical protein
MNFYRVGKVVGVTANTELLLNQSQYTHKAILFQNGTSPLGGAVKLTFHDANNSTPAGITLTIPSAAAATPFIFPGVVRSITPVSTQYIVLLG